MNDRAQTSAQKAHEREAVAEEEILDPRLTLDEEGDAETTAELAAEESSPESAQAAAGERARMGETALGGENIAQNDGLLQTNQVDTQGLPSRSQATPADAGSHAAPVRARSNAEGEPPRDGGYGANRDRERAINEPGDLAPGRPHPRDPITTDNDSGRIPHPGAGQPTGPENTWRERGGDDRVVGDDNRQYNGGSATHHPPASENQRPESEKSASIDVGTDEDR